MIRTMKTLSVFFAVLLLSACATAPGAKFAGIDKLSPSKGDIYLYRGDAFFASGQAFTVSVNGSEAGQLFNASYLKLQLTPGEHTITVNPGPLTKVSSKVIRVEGGKAGFYEYDFVTGPLANVFFVGAEIELRDEAKAVEDLKQLKAAQL